MPTIKGPITFGKDKPLPPELVKHFGGFPFQATGLKCEALEEEKE